MGGSGGKDKLCKATRLVVNSICRDTLMEIEIFLNGIKSFVPEDRLPYIDEAYEKIKMRIFDVGGRGSRRIDRYLEGWDVKQVDDGLDWVEFGPRI